jgi:hypothetical protein
MHASVVGQRTKAVRALGSLITVDPDVLLDVSQSIGFHGLEIAIAHGLSRIDGNQAIIARQVCGQFSRCAGCRCRSCRQIYIVKTRCRRRILPFDKLPCDCELLVNHAFALLPLIIPIMSRIPA